MLTVKRIAEKYGVTSQAVLYLIKKGVLKAEKKGGIYFLKEDVQVPESWKRGEKGRVAYYICGGVKNENK